MLLDKYQETSDGFPADIWDAFSPQCKGVMLCCREFGKIMMKNKRGKIINLSSVRGSRATLWEEISAIVPQRSSGHDDEGTGLRMGPIQY